MKCLLVSDLHYALKQYDWTSEVAPDFDVVVIAGDHLDISGHVAGPVQIVVILKYLKRLMAQTRLLVCSGNHDLDARDETGEKVPRWMARVRALGIPTDGDSVAHGDTLFTICPWWDGPNARQAVYDQIARDAAKPKKSWVWVYHAPPDRSPTSWTGQRWYGDTDLGRAHRRLIRPTSCSPATSIRRPSPRAVPGSTASAQPGCSTAASSRARRRPTS